MSGFKVINKQIRLSLSAAAPAGTFFAQANFAGAIGVSAGLLNLIFYRFHNLSVFIYIQRYDRIKFRSLRY